MNFSVSQLHFMSLMPSWTHFRVVSNKSDHICLSIRTGAVSRKIVAVSLHFEILCPQTYNLISPRSTATGCYERGIVGYRLKNKWPSKAVREKTTCTVNFQRALATVCACLYRKIGVPFFIPSYSHINSWKIIIWRLKITKRFLLWNNSYKFLSTVE